MGVGVPVDTLKMGDTASSRTCAFHVDRAAYVACTACGSTACPDCIVRMPAGMVCLDCLNPQGTVTAVRTPPRTPVLSRLREHAIRRSATDHEKLFRPGAVFYAVVAFFIALCVVAASLEYTGRVTMLQSAVGFGIVLVGALLSLIFHEYAHAAVAYIGGDTEVPEKGYLTLDPRRYADWVSTVILPIGFLILGGAPVAGGAVWISESRLTRRMASLVSLAGPAANLVFGLLLVGAVRTGLFDGAPLLAGALSFLAVLQFVVAIFNLIPVPGFDGYGAIEPFLPSDLRRALEPVKMFGYLVVLFLMLSTDIFDFVWNWSFAWADALGMDALLILLGVELGVLESLQVSRL